VKLLEKYDKRVPKTWDELIETSQYILEKERVLYNNTNLLAYNGLFNGLFKKKKKKKFFFFFFFFFFLYFNNILNI